MITSTQSTFLKFFRCSRFSEFDINYNWKFQRQVIIHGECGKRSDGGGGGEGRGVSGFPRKMMSEHRAQKFRSDDVSLPMPRSG